MHISASLDENNKSLFLSDNTSSHTFLPSSHSEISVPVKRYFAITTITYIQVLINALPVLYTINLTVTIHVYKKFTSFAHINELCLRNIRDNSIYDIQWSIRISSNASSIWISLTERKVTLKIHKKCLNLSIEFYCHHFSSVM